MRRLVPILMFVLAAIFAAPATAAPTKAPAQDRDWCRQVPPAATWSVKNVEVLCRVDAVRHTWNADGTLALDPTTPSGYRETLTQVDLDQLHRLRQSARRPAGRRRRRGTSCSSPVASA